MRALLIGALILVALILGVATTLGIAWGLAYWQSDPYSGVGEIGWSHETGDGWMVRRWDERGSTRLHALAVSEWVAGGKQSFDADFVPRWSGLRARPDRFDETHFFDARGWPWRAMIQVRIQRSGSPATTLHVLEVDAPSSTPRWPRITRVTLPTKPLWLGFIGNTLLFGVAWFAVLSVLLFGPILLRRWWRRRRGRCPLCAYDLRHDLKSGCPECGWRRGKGAHAGVTS